MHDKSFVAFVVSVTLSASALFCLIYGKKRGCSCPFMKPLPSHFLLTYSKGKSWCPCTLPEPKHGLLNTWTELLYLSFPHEADLFTLILLHKLTQYL